MRDIGALSADRCTTTTTNTTAQIHANIRLRHWRHDRAIEGKRGKAGSVQHRGGRCNDLHRIVIVIVIIVCDVTHHDHGASPVIHDVFLSQVSEAWWRGIIIDAVICHVIILLHGQLISK